MNQVVKITVDEDGQKIPDAKWCLVDPCNDQGSSQFCTGQFFGAGESAVKYEAKTGKITCPDCIENIKIYKSIKL